MKDQTRKRLWRAQDNAEGLSARRCSKHPAQEVALPHPSYPQHWGWDDMYVGLVYDEIRDVLYESAGLYRESTVREVNVTTGEVIRYVPMQPRDFAEGLALNHDRLVRVSLPHPRPSPPQTLAATERARWANRSFHAVNRVCEDGVASCGPNATDLGSGPIALAQKGDLSPPRAPETRSIVHVKNSISTAKDTRPQTQPVHLFRASTTS